MVRPGWQYLIQGGTAGQQLTKISSADGDYEWAAAGGGGGSPGGADTQIQYNNAGSFGGITGLTYNGTIITATIIINASGGLVIENRTSDPGSPVSGQIWLRTDL
jgi:hypothetical protein